MRRLRLLLGLLVLVLVTGGCDAVLEAGLPTSTDSTQADAATPGARKALRLLAALPAGARVSPSSLGYDRDAFGSAWADVDGNGCNQRDDVLLRDAVPGSTTVAVQGSCDHDVLAGTWVDPYTGRRLTFDDLKDPGQAQAIQIDHVVPLAEAWTSGAVDWSDERRRRYANDLGVLLASDGPTNAAKSDDDPAAWRPRQAYQCRYARQWVAVKSAWDLSVDDSERRALEEMLAAC
ncbi:HNH endonuclease family protein [Nocardioides bruguierae]|uniref:HNH endonuclease family protein n=1 Tax=Nocardioides bruguierae TaxID=2945102 RepID=A0A9X2IH33_9ACTN|nr:HNH endonuclease family protein [Nocardioides bruguierae]MCM0622643.1 HNH endonuclease family protein [Nocardioides bruguierae]